MKTTDKKQYNNYFYIGAIFFFLMLILPTTFQLQRGVLLAFLVSVSFIAAFFQKRYKLNNTIFHFFVIALVAGPLFSFLGGINNGPGAVRVLTVYFLWPIVYMLFVGLLRDKKVLTLLNYTIVISSIVASIMGLVLLYGAYIDNQNLMDLFAFQGGIAIIYEGFTEFTLYNMGTVIYAFPFLFSMLLFSGENKYYKNKKTIIFAFFIAVILCILSGRRAFVLVAFITPFWVYILMKLARQKIRIARLSTIFIVSGVFLIAVVYRFNLDFDSLKEQFFLGFNFSNDISANLREQQFFALISDWLDSPFIGTGLGTGNDTITRSNAMPWAYELSYMALLAQTGLLGFFIYTLMVIWIFYAGINTVRIQSDYAPIIIPLLAGLGGFLLVNATNPYLFKFDYLWTIFLPIAAINSYRVNKCE
jgi:O-antigen ligase